MPADWPIHDRLDEPEPLAMLVGVRMQERLVELVETARVTVALKALRGAIVIVEEPATFTLTLAPVGLADIAKSPV